MSSARDVQGELKEQLNGAGSPWRWKGWSGKASERRDVQCGPHRKTKDWPGAMGEGIPERKPSILPSLIANSRAYTGAITAPSEEHDKQPSLPFLGLPALRSLSYG